jgi:hypothetical protein
MALQHPFRQEPRLEIDLQYGVDCYAALGPQVRTVRRQRLGVLRAIAAAVEPIDQRLLARRHVRIDCAPGVRPMFAAMMVVLLDWPDRALPRRLARGFAIAGEIEPSGVLRPIEATTSGNTRARAGERLLGPDAEAFVDVHNDSGLVIQSATSRPYDYDWGVELPTQIVYYDAMNVGFTREDVDIRMQAAN